MHLVKFRAIRHKMIQFDYDSCGVPLIANLIKSEGEVKVRLRVLAPSTGIPEKDKL